VGTKCKQWRCTRCLGLTSPVLVLTLYTSNRLDRQTLSTRTKDEKHVVWLGNADGPATTYDDVACPCHEATYTSSNVSSLSTSTTFTVISGPSRPLPSQTGPSTSLPLPQVPYLSKESFPSQKQPKIPTKLRVSSTTELLSGAGSPSPESTYFNNG
jgi:hypothetical protein